MRKVFIKGINAYRSERFKRKFTGDAGDNTKACTDSDWTEFYDVDFGTEYKYFSEVVYKCSNLDHIKIEIDGVEVLQGPLIALKKVLVDDDGIQMRDLDMSYVNNISTVYLDLNYQKGKHVKMYQKKRIGSGDLTAKGFILTYTEKV